MLNLKKYPKTEEKFNVSYREDATKYFMERALNVDSSILTSIPGLGKSVFLRFLSFHPKVKQHYLNEDAKKVIFIPIDLNDLSEPTSNAFYFLALRRCMEALFRENQKEKHINYIEDVYNKSKEITIVSEILDELKNVVSYLCYEHDLKLVMIIDKFDWACKNFNNAFFNNLRSIRDTAKEKFSYIFASIREPLKVASLEKIMSAYDLAATFQYYLKPLNRSSSIFEIERIKKEKGLNLKDSQIKELINISGGHPGIFKTIIQVFCSENSKNAWDSVKNKLIRYPSLQIQLRRIWEYFNDAEQAVLLDLVNGKTKDQLNPMITNKLLKKHAIENDGNKLITFTPLLNDYITEFQSKNIKITLKEGIWLNSKINTVYKDGVEVEKPLTKSEYALLLFLYENEERICERDEIAEAVWGAEAIEGVSDEAIDQLITRLRKKIEDDKSSPKYVITIRGRGFRFRKNP